MGGGELEILEVVHAFPPHSVSGTELYTLNLSRALQSLGHRVTVLHPLHDQPGPDLELVPAEHQGIGVLELHRREPRTFPPRHLDPRLDELFADLLQERRFDLVHFQHVIGLSASWIRIAKESGARVVLKLDDMFMLCPTIHLVNSANEYCGEGPTSIDKCVGCVWMRSPTTDASLIGERFACLAERRAVLRELMRVPDFIHTPSRFVRDMCLRFDYRNDRFRVIPTGIVPCEPVERPLRLAGRIRVGYLGTLHARKGILDFLGAIEITRAGAAVEPLSAELVFEIHGSSAHQGLTDRVRSTIEPWPEVTYEGPFEHSERGQVFAGLDLVVVPSIGENYPFILREALDAGVPVVATEIAGVPEIVSSGRNGWLYPPGDNRALAEILLDVARDPGRLDRLQVEPGSARSYEVEARELDGIFRDLVHGSGFSTELARGIELAREGHWEAACLVFRELMQREGDHPQVLLGLGVCAFHTGDVGRAFTLFQSAHVLDRDDPDIVVNWFLAARKLDRLDELRDPVRGACALHPDDEDLAQALALLDAEERCT